MTITCPVCGDKPHSASIIRRVVRDDVCVAHNGVIETNRNGTPHVSIGVEKADDAHLLATCRVCGKCFNCTMAEVSGDE